MERNDKINLLAERLAKAKAVMAKVNANESSNRINDGIQPQRKQRTITEEMYDVDDIDNTQYLSEEQLPIGNQSPNMYADDEPEIPMPPQQQQQPKFIPYKNINKTKMPSAIVESFRQQPMIDPTQPLGMESLTEQLAKKLNPPRQPVSQQAQQQTKIRQNPTSQPIVEQKSTMDIQLLEFVIQKTVEATIKEISKQTKLDENIQIKIGDKTFSGKITTLKELKK